MTLNVKQNLCPERERERSKSVQERPEIIEYKTPSLHLPVAATQRGSFALKRHFEIFLMRQSDC